MFVLAFQSDDLQFISRNGFRERLEIFSKREKVYACDNDFFKCGKNYQGIWIESMDEVVEKHTKAIYVISSSKYFEELKSQVLSRGISPNQIVGL